MKHNVLAYNGKGKVGNMVGYTRGGVQMFRAWQPIVANPRTARQVLSRAKLSLAASLARGLAPVLRVSYADEADTRVSARNLFTKQIIPVDAGVITGTTPSALTVNYEDMPIAKGSITVPEFDEPDLETPLTVKVGLTSIPNSADIYTAGDGSPRAAFVYLVVYNKDNGKCVYTNVMIHDGEAWVTPAPDSVAVIVPTNWQGARVEMWGFVKQTPLAKNGISVSTEPYRIPGATSASVYLGNGTIA